MTKEEPLEEALYAIKNLVAMLQENLFIMVDAEEVKKTEKVLDELEKKVRKFEKQAIDELQEVGLTTQQRRMLEEGEIPEGVKGTEREALELMQGLMQKIEDLKLAAEEEGGESKPPKEKKSKKSAKQQHKKKYKRLGGDDWKPL